MNADELPKGAFPKAIAFPHFPTPFQSVIWRNWGLVPQERLCRILECTQEQLRDAAESLGLAPDLLMDPVWLKRSCNTIIRANWHLLQYDQLLTLLDWTADEFSNQLQWDDFLWLKLGLLKPDCERPVFRELTKDEKERTLWLRQVVQKHFPKDEMKKMPEPFKFYDGLPGGDLEKVSVATDAPDGLRLVYSYSARYGDPLLDPSLDPYPDSLLAALSKKRINAIYLQGVLTQLSPFDDLPEISAGYETRLKNLNMLIERAARFGIGVFLYLNEPRGFTREILRKHPELREKYSSPMDPEFDTIGMCTSKPAVREHLRKGIRFIAERVPGLAGVFLIVCSENPTNCWSHAGAVATNCPECMKKGAPAVYADVFTMIAEALHSVNPKIKVLCWDWGFYRNEWKEKVIRLLPKDVSILCTSENNARTKIGGIENRIADYSISQPGPSEISMAEWKLAKERGLGCAAKVQLSNSWELSTVPYIPATFLVEEHLDRLKKLGIKDFMISWTLGGWPSINMELLTKTHRQMVEDNFGPSAVESISLALKGFSEAFRNYPFSQSVAYHAPHNAGPKELLYATPTGYKATMVGFPYDDLKLQSYPYPDDVFENQWRILTEKWRDDGLIPLEAARKDIAPQFMKAYQELCNYSKACWCHFRSAYCQVAWNRRRNNPGIMPKMDLVSILNEEITLAKQLLSLTFEDSRIGFEATNHYAYSPNDLREKVLNCEWLLKNVSANQVGADGNLDVAD